MFPDWPYHAGGWPHQDDAERFDPDAVDPVDDVLSRRVADRLLGDPGIRSGQVVIEVQNRVAILHGWIRTAEACRAAGQHAWDTPGIVDVNNRLRPGRPGDLA